MHHVENCTEFGVDIFKEYFDPYFYLQCRNSKSKYFFFSLNYNPRQTPRSQEAKKKSPKKPSPKKTIRDVLVEPDVQLTSVDNPAHGLGHMPDTIFTNEEWVSPGAIKDMR